MYNGIPKSGDDIKLYAFIVVFELRSLQFSDLVSNARIVNLLGSTFVIPEVMLVVVKSSTSS